MKTGEDVLNFWFGPAPLPNRSMPDFAKWFRKNKIFDDEIRAQFSELLDESEVVERWGGTARGRLAAVILWDQFPRNIFRGSPQAFAYDDRARGVARASVNEGDEAKLHVLERMFLYLPFQHSENLQDQVRSIAFVERLAADAPVGLGEVIGQNLFYAKRHWEIIARFGRFPHRNEVLGRESTAEEIEFLKEPNSSF